MKRNFLAMVFILSLSHSSAFGTATPVECEGIYLACGLNVVNGVSDFCTQFEVITGVAKCLKGLGFSLVIDSACSLGDGFWEWLKLQTGEMICTAMKCFPAIYPPVAAIKLACSAGAVMKSTILCTSMITECNEAKAFMTPPLWVACPTPHDSMSVQACEGAMPRDPTAITKDCELKVKSAAGLKDAVRSACVAKCIQNTLSSAAGCI